MRKCPECQVDMEPTKRTFAVIDVCPKCHGAFLDTGEGVSAYGAEAEVRFLLDDGRATRLHPGKRPCANGHGPMVVLGIHTGQGQVEVDLCEECGGFFLEAGEGEALAAMDAAPAGTFALPPRQSAHDAVVAEARKSGESFLGRFVLGFVGRRGPK